MSPLDAGRRRDDRRALRQVKAAQLRAKAIRWGIGKSVLGSVFLVGALAYALGPDPRAQASVVWMAVLVVMSTFNIGLGLRTFAKVSRQAARLWLPATLTWGVLATAVVKLLLDGRP